MSNNSNTILGVLTATAVGATLGVLFAPDKGSNTRKKIIEGAQDAKANLVNEVSNLEEEIVNTVISKKETLEEQVESLVSDASYKAEDVITTLEQKLSELKMKNKKLQKS